ncbi:MAG: hypothetical protein K2X11_22300 [Acetobacteraceae bacterium]|nr:hypothetical protein [Acetobacteraceae bacterium]
MDAVSLTGAGRATPAPAARARPEGSFDLALARATEAAPPRGRPLSGIGAAPLQAWQAAPNGDFRHRIAQAERSAEHANNGYGQRNPSSGALGRYQFLPSTLVDLGWKDAAGNWTAQAQRQGVRSDAEFLANPTAQEAAMTAFLRRVENQLDRNGSLTRQGTTVRGINGQEVTLTEGGLVAAAHRRGSGMVARYLNHVQNTPDAPLSPRDRQAFQTVERRLMDFAEVSYASLRARPPSNLALAAASG